MLRIFLTFLFFVCYAFAVPAHAEDVGVLHLNPLHLTFPATWTFDGSNKPIEGRGPDGEKVLITIMKHIADNGSNASQSGKDLASNFAKNQMHVLATKAGQTVVRPVTHLPTPEGKTGFSAASENSGLFTGERYFVQYLLASNSAVIYLTVEGKGKASVIYKSFDEIMRTQQWDE
jgi:hypothetical protein